MPNLAMKELSTTAKSTSFNWRIVGLLLFLTGIPAIPSFFILALVVMGSSAGAEPSTLINALHFETPMAVIVHGLSGIVLFLTMPFQFSPALRSKHLKLHKLGGRVAVVSGYILALSGIWMHHALFPGSFGARYLSLIVISVGMCLSFSIALTHVINGNVSAHRKWMCRAVAITLAVVTPLFIEPLLYLFFNGLENTYAVLQQLQHDYGRLLGMAINLFLVEYVLYKERRARASYTDALIGT
ncbi:DUF2306 domain-containing protein [Marinimicrobium sp. ABcell2]|uniref:DUF2306 domain-containing protein n=1 Tax=Marinimicrobium sp. ABcell2 TaxID=3069751 RepID=UPI0027B461B3|nr:DUF2306 domain-containing protein [Marinimicrobium sp. ABcell2]MDQ2078210.1 DUF2306 domain-containing protein [Marinimicrobium sp. ABcell2]